jgi:TRAP-type C4-dicarboxylate transport system permease large subunit
MRVASSVILSPPRIARSPADVRMNDHLPSQHHRFGPGMRGTVLLALSATAAILAAPSFTRMHGRDLIVPGAGVTARTMLSAYHAPLGRTAGDSEVFILEGAAPGGTLLVLGGTHADEPAGYLAALVLVERARVERGRLIVIPRGNASGFTHNVPQEGHPQSFAIPTPNGIRRFTYGARATNPVHQWPDPLVYLPADSAQVLSGSETRNLNRAYPGRADGTLTEQIAFAITQVLRRERVALAFDLHEASPEYPVVNTIVAHQRAMDVAALSNVGLQGANIEIGLEASPEKLRGLSHREWGDQTPALAVLMETADPAQGRLRGRTDARLVVDGRDRFYEAAAGAGRLSVPFTAEGWPLDRRVARHLAGVAQFAQALSEAEPARAVVLRDVPDYESVSTKGVGAFLGVPASGPSAARLPTGSTQDAAPLIGRFGRAAEPLTLAAMLAGFSALVAWRKWPIGLALTAGAWLGAALHGDVLPVRQLTEGAFSFLDPLLVIATAMMFMRVLADGGALDSMGAAVVRRFASRPVLLLPSLTLIVMFPGMITGSSTAAVLTTGTMVGATLVGLGLSRERAGALIAMGGVLGMIAPPVNIPAMLIGSGIDLPYVGFAPPLALASFPLALVLSYGLGWPLVRRGATRAASVAFADRLPLARALVGPGVAAVLMAAPRIWPRVPDPGLPLTFLVSAGVSVVCAWRRGGRTFSPFLALTRAVEESLPVLGILVGVGAFIQVMTFTGARGWLVALLLGTPAWATIGAAAVGLPLFGAVSAFGSASVLGVPFLLVMLGRNEVVTAAALSALAALGDLMLPAALAATLAAQATGVDDRKRVLRLCALPAIAIALVAVIMLLFSTEIGRVMR